MIDMTKWADIARENVNKRPTEKSAGRLGGKIAIVTGSAQGFGKGIAEILCKEGAAVVIADLNYDLAREVALSLGENAFAVKVTLKADNMCFAALNGAAHRGSYADICNRREYPAVNLGK